MKTKKMILILILIFSLSFVLTGCSTVGEFKTKTRINDYLTSSNGPETVIEQSFNKLVSEMSNSENPDLNKYNWEFNVSLKEVNIINSKADDEGSGILNVEDVVLIYDYTITGKSDSNKDINKDGQLSYEIGRLVYDDNKNVLIEITQTRAGLPDDSLNKSPKISDFKPDYSDGFSFTATIENNTADSLGVFSLGDRSLPDPDKVLEISGGQISLNTNLTLNETDFASILVINYDELLDGNSAQTGIGSMLISVP